jgi:oligoribonuclease NrnB/cAMP/cGMP phosphodiesterase (DHH superfamily)
LAQITAIVDEYEPMLNRGYMGARWEEVYDEFLQKLTEAGYDELMEEIQRQVDAHVQLHNISWNNFPLPRYTGSRR